MSLCSHLDVQDVLQPVGSAPTGLLHDEGGGVALVQQSTMSKGGRLTTSQFVVIYPLPNTLVFYGIFWPNMKSLVCHVRAISLRKVSPAKDRT